MKKLRFMSLLPAYILILAGFILGTFLGNEAVTAMSENTRMEARRRIVIDAGHGGEDGGATSCSGVLESNINLEISLRLNDLFHFLGYDTVMIRTTDCSVYTQGNTIAQHKVSDLKQRVKITNETENPLLISIHQNLFADSRYSGAQVFYAPTLGSETLAKQLQSDLVQYLNPGSNRKSKKASGVYLMEHVNCTGVLVECGFISNPEEESMLRSKAYQNKLCCIIAASVCNYLDRA